MPTEVIYAKMSVMSLHLFCVPYTIRCHFFSPPYCQFKPYFLLPIIILHHHSILVHFYSIGELFHGFRSRAIFSSPISIHFSKTPFPIITIYKKSVIKFGAFIYFLYFCASFVYVYVSSTNEQYFEIYDKPFIICELESSVLW